jgi:hypothetical protein
MSAKTLIIASLVASAVAFRPASMARPSMNKLSMSAEGLAGQTAPFGFFDPLSLSAGKSDGEVKVIPIFDLFLIIKTALSVCYNS